MVGNTASRVSFLTLLLFSTSRGEGVFKVNNEFKIMPGHTVFDDYNLALPHTYVDAHALPDSFTWNDKDGVSYLTKMLNQHVPQYCGSCWAHGALSALADRVKISRDAKGDDINFAIQHILNCATEVAGSCHGGSATGVYEFVKKTGYVPFDTCQPYIACSQESKEGFCEHVDTTCKPENICRTCNTFSGFPFNGKCTAITPFPNCTVAEYGRLPQDAHAIMAEIYTRGPVAAGINAEGIVDNAGEIVMDDDKYGNGVNHIVSIVGWGKDEKSGHKYWIIRNSWGQYWGSMGFVRVVMGKNVLGIESEVSWATPGVCTESNFPCDEDGRNCDPEAPEVHRYVDPAHDVEAVQRRLLADQQ